MFLSHNSLILHEQLQMAQMEQYRLSLHHTMERK
jgi:hypothetical protein